MNPTKFVVLLVIGILCANVSARVVEDESKETKIGISNPKTNTKGVEAELSVYTDTNSYSSGNGQAFASRGPKGPSASSFGNGYTGTSGFVFADGPKAQASSRSASGAQGRAAAKADRKGAAARANGSGGSFSATKGRTDKGKKDKKDKKDDDKTD